MIFLFVLGNTPELAFAELANFATNLQKVGTNLAIGETEEKPENLIRLLGGTVKIAEVLSENTKLTGIINGDFGVSDYTGGIDIPLLCKNIKEETGKRFVLPQKDGVLSSVVVRKQKLTEIILTDWGAFKTVAVQDFEDWGKRDYGRPCASSHIGMLPPKVARMMVNIGASKGMRILDPFCGTGTILMEALTIDCEAVGSDINPEQVEKTLKNLAWLGEKAELFVGDASKVSQKVDDIDAVVTEADLGPRPGLEELYLNCLIDWKKILKPKGKIVVALPFVKNIIDEAKRMGYTHLAGPYIYARPQAKIKRHILVFQYGAY